MSRSNPSNNVPNPCTRWHEWNGSNGNIRFWDKEAKNLKDQSKKGEYIIVKQPFLFLLLEELATVKGWHDGSESSIYSNEVKDIKAEVLVVKAHKGGEIASGLYGMIKDRVKASGGYYVANLYIAFKNERGNLVLGSIQFSGAAMNAWVEFYKANRAEMYKKAVKIAGFTEGKKGSIKYCIPRFSLIDVAQQTDDEAGKIQVAVQAYLKDYFGRTRQQQTATPPPDASDISGGPIPEDVAEVARRGTDSDTAPGVCPQCNMPIPPTEGGKCPNCTQNDDVPF